MMDVKLGEHPIGQHGSNIYYKEFSVVKGDVVKQYRLGRFYFVQKSLAYPVTIAEFQLIWKNITSEKKFASVKLYFKPGDYENEDRDEDEQNNYGKDEVIEASKQVVIECSKFTKWQCSHNLWSSAVGEPLYGGIKPSKIQGLLEKAVPKSDKDNFDVKVLGFPQYCRYRTCLKMLEAGVPMTYRQLLARGGLDLKNPNTIIVFSRRSLDYEDIEDLSLTENIRVPVFKGRPRKRKNLIPAMAVEKKKTKPEETDNVKIPPKIIQDLLPPTNSNKKPEAIKLVKLRKVIRGRDTVSITRHKQDEQNRETKDEFSNKLFEFMKERGEPVIKVPSIGCAPVEPLTLYNAVKKFGGYGQVTLNRLWRNVYDCLGHSTMITNAATGTRKIYEKLLLPYEKHLRMKENNDIPKEPIPKDIDSAKSAPTIVVAAEEKLFSPMKTIEGNNSIENNTSIDNTSIENNTKQRRTSTKFNNQIERLRNRQIQKLEEAKMNHRVAPSTHRPVGKKPPWVNELNVDIVNCRRKSDVSLSAMTERRVMESELISPRKVQKSPKSAASDLNNIKTFNKGSSSSSVEQSHPKKQGNYHKQQGSHHRSAGSLCEFKIQSVRSLAPPDRRQEAPKSSQYLHYPFSSSYQYAAPSEGSRQYFALNEANTLVPISEQYNTPPKYPFRGNYPMRAQRHNDHASAESNSYKIKSAALKNHEPYIIHHPTHVHRAYHSELPNAHYPVVYTHHQRYIMKGSGGVPAAGRFPPEHPVNRHGMQHQQRQRTHHHPKHYPSTNELIHHEPAPPPTSVGHVPTRDLGKSQNIPGQQLEMFPSVGMIAEPIRVLPNAKWPNPVSCNI